jgi:hypothetical protein
MNGSHVRSSVSTNSDGIPRVTVEEKSELHSLDWTICTNAYRIKPDFKKKLCVKQELREYCLFEWVWSEVNPVGCECVEPGGWNKLVMLAQAHTGLLLM